MEDVKDPDYARSDLFGSLIDTDLCADIVATVQSVCKSLQLLAAQSRIFAEMSDDAASYRVRQTILGFI